MLHDSGDGERFSLPTPKASTRDQHTETLAAISRDERFKPSFDSGAIRLHCCEDRTQHQLTRRRKEPLFS